MAAGYARPRYGPFDPSPRRDAPRLVGMLNVDFGITPGAVFAGEVLGPLSGETEELMDRPGLRRYYQVRPK